MAVSFIICLEQYIQVPLSMNNTKPRTVIFTDLGKIAYQEAWDHQHKILDGMVEVKRHNRQQESEDNWIPQKNNFLFCEHYPVYTLGKSGSMDHLLLSQEELAQKKIAFYKSNRGGDITYHGPGQVVGYPIFDLEYFFTDVHKYVRFLEEAVIKTLAEYDIEAGREEGFTGVWLPATEVFPLRKICAIGVHLRRWITMHGFALNVNTDLTYFGNIVPCGISDANKAVTSMAHELGQTIDMGEVKRKLKVNFSEVFDFQWFE